MPTLYIYFKPTEAPKYRVQWKRATDTLYPPANTITAARTNDVWNLVQAAIADTDTDWNYKVTALCGISESAPIYGIVRAACKKVAFTATYNPCTCYQITGITTTTSLT